MNKPYVVTTHDDGSVSINTFVGATIEQNTDNQAYCDYLSWETRQSEKADQTLNLRSGISYFFGDEDTLIKFCKDRGIMIHVEYVPGSRRMIISTFDSIDVKPNAPPNFHVSTDQNFYMLSRAVLNQQHPVTLMSGPDSEARSELVPGPSNIWASAKVLEYLGQQLHESNSDVRKLSSWPLTRTFVYIDVSDFTKEKPGHQALIINSIISLVNTPTNWTTGVVPDVLEFCEAKLCIGDGYIFAFTDSMRATYFAAHLAQLIENSIALSRIYANFHFRMGVHVGKVFFFWDFGRDDWNYVGDGINGGNRVLTAIGKEADNIVFVSAQVRNQLIGKGYSPYRDILESLQNRGRRADKHGNLWRVYELNHSRLTADSMPFDLQETSTP